MLVLRCTQKLLAPLARHPRDDAAVSTTRLGDWYGHLYFTRQGRFALCVNERTLLPVVVPARAPSGLLVRVRASILTLLERIGVSQASITAEADAMAWIVVAATQNRSVLGSMND